MILKSFYLTFITKLIFFFINSSIRKIIHLNIIYREDFKEYSICSQKSLIIIFQKSFIFKTLYFVICFTHILINIIF